MKVAFFTVIFLENGGGLAKYFIETSSHLAKAPRIEADVITMDDKFTLNIARLTHIFYMSFVLKMNKQLIYKEKIENIKKNLGSANYFKINSIGNLRKKLQEYDLIYSKNEVLEAFILKFLVGYKNIPPVIFGCHTPFYYPQTTSIQSKLHNFLYNGFVYKFLTSDVKAFHVLNTLDENKLRKLFPKKKIFKIPNPLNFTQFTSLKENFFYNFPWKKKKYNVLWVSRLAEGKGISELLWIIDFINSNGYEDKIEFNIVGDGSKVLREQIKKVSDKWNNMHYLGSIEFKYMPSIYNENDLFICTSKWETFSYSILEAQAFGLPVIAFKMPAGPRDIIQENKTGIFVSNKQEFAKQIIEIVTKRKNFQSDTIKKIIRNTFSSKKIYKKLQDMLYEVL